MAEKKKNKKLRDINKDGKVNFGDTWLGDALGFDGKVGIQKGRPGLKESLKGARRGSASKSEDKPKDTPKRSTSRSTPSKKKVDIEKLAGKAIDRAERQRGRAGKTEPRITDPKTRKMYEKLKDKFPVEPNDSSKGVPAPSKVETTPLGKKEKPTPSKPEKKSFLDNTMSNDDYRARRQAELGKIRAGKKEASATAKDQAKVTQDYLRTREGLEALQKGITGKALDKKALEWSKSKKSGMAEGGMARSKEGRYQQNGGRDMKKTGMFYKSSSPKGYK